MQDTAFLKSVICEKVKLNSVIFFVTEVFSVMAVTQTLNTVMCDL